MCIIAPRFRSSNERREVVIVSFFVTEATNKPDSEDGYCGRPQIIFHSTKEKKRCGEVVSLCKPACFAKHDVPTRRTSQFLSHDSLHLSHDSSQLPRVGKLL